MQPHEWRALGFHVVIRERRVWLFRPRSGALYSAPLAKGFWEHHDDVLLAPWRTEPAIPMEFMAILRDCYCSRLDELCAYCAGATQPHPLDCGCGPHRSLASRFCSTACQLMWIRSVAVLTNVDLSETWIGCRWCGIPLENTESMGQMAA